MEYSRAYINHTWTTLFPIGGLEDLMVFFQDYPIENESGIPVVSR